MTINPYPQRDTTQCRQCDRPADQAEHAQSKPWRLTFFLSRTYASFSLIANFIRERDLLLLSRFFLISIDVRSPSHQPVSAILLKKELSLFTHAFIAGDDVHQFCGDRFLPSPAISAGQLLQMFFQVVLGCLHGRKPAAMFTGL